MDIRQMIDEINIKLIEETKRLEDQKIVVEELGNQYSEQSAILRVIRQSIQNLNKNLIELKRNQAPGRGAKPSKELIDDETECDENYKKLTELLNEAVDIAVRNCLIVEEVSTKQGVTLNMRRSIINRARNSIIRRCPSEYRTYIDWVRHMTDDDIHGLRNVGKKTGDVIKIARTIMNGKPVKGDM